MSEWLTDQDFCDVVPPTTWTTRDGRTLPIAEMTDDHLLATIRYLRRRNRLALFKITMRESLLRYRYAETAPDGAAMAAEDEARNLTEPEGQDTLLAERLPVFAALLEEARYRRLSA